MHVNIITDAIRAREKDYIKVWEDVCNIESPTKYKEGVDAAGSYLAALAEKKGWLVERYPQPIAGDVISITMNPDASLPPITLSGHLDTVHPVGSFGTPAVRLDETKIYGPGVIDCKGGIVAGLLAMDALESCGFTTRPIRMILQTDEENSSSVSGKATIRYICEKAKDSLAFFNLEGYRVGKACIQRKGILNLTFYVDGVAAHASNCAKAGANAIVEAAHKIIALETLKDDKGLTCSCGVIEGGTVPNTVAEHCMFKVNIRYATKEQLSEAWRFAREVADTVYVPGCTCRMEQMSERVAMEYSDQNAALLDQMNRIWEENGLPTLVPSPSNGGSDAADVTTYGIPCVDSIGVSGGGIHAPTEYANLASLAESAQRLAVVIAAL